jgi:hypothetical protein
MSADAFLQQWARVTHELTQLLDAALDVEPPGACPEAWTTWLARFDVAPMEENARLNEVMREKQTKGAPIHEVEACLEALAEHAAASLAPFRAQLTPQQAALVEESLHELASNALSHYRVKATEKKKGMFGAAKALAHQHQYGGAAASTGYVLTCAVCRAPRLGESLTCAFCGGDLEGVS